MSCDRRKINDIQINNLFNKNCLNVITVGTFDHPLNDFDEKIIKYNFSEFKFKVGNILLNKTILGLHIGHMHHLLQCLFLKEAFEEYKEHYYEQNPNKYDVVYSKLKKNKINIVILTNSSKSNCKRKINGNKHIEVNPDYIRKIILNYFFNNFPNLKVKLFFFDEIDTSNILNQAPKGTIYLKGSDYAPINIKSTKLQRKYSIILDNISKKEKQILLNNDCDIYITAPHSEAVNIHSFDRYLKITKDNSKKIIKNGNILF